MVAVTSLGGVSVVAPLAKTGLVADVQYFEQFGTAALNRKAFGIFGAGIYQGFGVTPGTGLNVTVSPNGNNPGVASINVNNFQITVQLLTAQTVALTAGKLNIILLKAVYGQGVLTKQVDSTATTEAASFVVVNAEKDIPANTIELARVTLAAGATDVTAALIDTSKRYNYQVSYEPTDDINDARLTRILTVKAGKSLLPLSGGTMAGVLNAAAGIVTTTLVASGAASVGSSLTVTGTAAFKSNVTIGGTTTLASFADDATNLGKSLVASISLPDLASLFSLPIGARVLVAGATSLAAITPTGTSYWFITVVSKRFNNGGVFLAQNYTTKDTYTGVSADGTAIAWNLVYNGGDMLVTGALNSQGAITASTTLNVMGAASVGSSLTVSGSALIGGNLTLNNSLAIASGGTGGKTKETARASLGAAVLGANNDITSMSALDTISSPLNVSNSLNVSGTLTTSYRVRIIRNDGYVPYMNFIRSDVIAGTAPAADTQMMYIGAFSAGSKDNIDGGNTLGIWSTYATTLGGGRNDIQARNASNVATSRIIMNGDAGLMSIGGDVTGSGTWTINGSFKANGGTTTTSLNATGAASVGSTLTVSGATALAGSATVGTTLTVTGNGTFKGDIDVAGSANFCNSKVSFNAAGGMELTGATPYIDFHYNNTITDFTARIMAVDDSSLKVIGNWYVDGQSTISSTLAVTGGLTANGGITTTTLNATGAASVGSSLTVSGSASIAGTLTLNNSLAIASGGTGGKTKETARASLGAAVLGANNDITSMSALGSISSALSIGNTLNVASTITSNYRMRIIRSDGFSPYIDAIRSDVVAGTPPAADTQAFFLQARSAGSATDVENGNVLGVFSIYATTGGGGKVDVQARDSTGAATSRIIMNGDAGYMAVTGDMQFGGTLTTNINAVAAFPGPNSAVSGMNYSPKISLIGNSGNAETLLGMQGFSYTSVSFAPGISSTRSMGAQGAHGQVPGGRNVFTLMGSASDGAAYQNIGRIDFYTSEATSSASAAGEVRIYTTPTKKTTPTLAATFGSDSSLSVLGNVSSAGAMSVSTTLTVGGSAAVTGAATVGGSLTVNGLIYSGTMRASQYLDLGQQNTVAGSRMITFYSAGSTTPTGTIKVTGNTTSDSTMTLNAGTLAVTADMTVSGAATLGTLTVNGGIQSAGGSFDATLTMGYRGIITRDAAIPYLTMRRQDVMAAPTADTEVGRLLFGYGMGSTDSWGTGGQLAYVNSTALAAGGGQLRITALNAAGAATAYLALDGNAGSVTVNGNATLGGSLSATGAVSVGSSLTVSGAAVLSNSLTVAGAITGNGGATFKSLAVTGVTTLSGSLIANGALQTTALTATSSATIGGALAANGGITTTAITVSGVSYFNAELRASQYIDIGPQNKTAGARELSFYAAGNNTTLSGKISVAGTTMSLQAGGVNVTGALSVGSSLTVSGAAVISSDITVAGNANVNGGLVAKGNLYAGDALIQTDGNIKGSVWGGYLNVYISDKFNSAYSPSNPPIMALYAVGSYIFATTSAQNVAAGATVAGSALFVSNAQGANVSTSINVGTWRCLGNIGSTDNNSGRTVLWQRIG